MGNWLLIIVATIFIVCIIAGYIQGFLKFGLSLLSTILTLILVLFLSPFVSDALEKFTPVDDLIEERCFEAFMPGNTDGRTCAHGSERYSAGKSESGRAGES